MVNDRPLATLRRLTGYLYPVWRSIALSVLLGTLTIASSVGLMATAAWMISKAALQPSIAALGVSVVAVRFFGITRGCLRYLERLISHDTTFRLLAEWRVRFYRAIEPLAPAGLMDLHSGDLLARVVGDIDALQDVYLRGIAPLVVAFLSAVLVLLFFGTFDPLVVFVMLAFLMMGGVGVPLYVWWKGQHLGQAVVTNRSLLFATVIDQVQGMADNLVYRQRSQLIQILARLSSQSAQTERQLGWLDGIQNALGILVVNGAALAVLAVAISRVDGIYLATLSLATVAAFEAVTPLAQTTTHLGTGLAAARRIFHIVDTPPAIKPANKISPLPKDYSLEFREVTFRYSSESAPVFSRLCFTIHTEQRVAIFGESGSGKSTLVNLLLRFWEYDAGTILLGGNNLRDYDPSFLRQQLGVMSQRTYLFNMTVMENIRLARPEATNDEVIRAAQAAQVHEFIASLPESYATYVGEDGAKLSGGERQRIALARVLLKNAPILIFDEPTANLDALTERAVWESILEASVGRTLIVMAHHLYFTEQFDLIIELPPRAVNTQSELPC